jgi:hypothetical protein
MVKRLDNLIHGSASASKWDNGSGSSSTSSNWDMINRVIEENPGNEWFIPKEDRYNAWTCPVIFTIGNIDLRDFALEQKFADMRHARVEEYDRKWEKARDRGDTEYLKKHLVLLLHRHYGQDGLLRRSHIMKIQIDFQYSKKKGINRIGY